jgi:putative heme-binding domain-containing protein
MRFAPLRLVALLSFSSAVFGQNAAAVAAGARIFRSHCAECHGMNGEGGRAPRLNTGVFFHGSTDADLTRNIADGIPGTAMPGVFFSEVQVSQIVAYVKSLSQARRSEPPPGNEQAGARLFREKGCIACHLVRGEGGVNGPDLSYIGSQRPVEHLRQAILDPNASVLREFWTARITLENGRQHSGFILNEDTHTIQILSASGGLQSLAKRHFLKFEIDKTSTMPSSKGQLSEGEVNDLVRYLWSLHRRKGSN